MEGQQFYAGGSGTQVAGAVAIRGEGDMVGALEELDATIEMFDQTIGELERRIAPVLSQYATAETLSHPTPEPASQLRGRVERLQHMRGALAQLIARIDL